MIGDIIALWEFILNQLQDREEDKKKLIEDFIDSVSSDFEKVHDNYIKTFRIYQNKIESSISIDFSSVINEIEKDSLFSEHLRSKLTVNIDVNNNLLNEIVRAIKNYLQSPGILLCDRIEPSSNVKRNSLIEVLRWIDIATPENLTDNGLLRLYNDIQNPDVMPENLIYRLDDAISNSHPEISPVNPNADELIQAQNRVDEIKKFLALQCITFIIKDTQKNYNLVREKCQQLSNAITGLNSN